MSARKVSHSIPRTVFFLGEVDTSLNITVGCVCSPRCIGRGLRLDFEVGAAKTNIVARVGAEEADRHRVSASNIGRSFWVHQIVAHLLSARRLFVVGFAKGLDNLVVVVSWFGASRDSPVGNHSCCQLDCDLGVGLQLVRAVDGGTSLVSLRLVLFKRGRVVSVGVRQASNHLRKPV